jgi:hypothetical protein
VGVIAYETLYVYDGRRYRIRHGLDVEGVPGLAPDPGS